MATTADTVACIDCGEPISKANEAAYFWMLSTVRSGDGQGLIEQIDRMLAHEAADPTAFGHVPEGRDRDTYLFERAFEEWTRVLPGDLVEAIRHGRAHS